VFSNEFRESGTKKEARQNTIPTALSSE